MCCVLKICYDRGTITHAYIISALIFFHTLKLCFYIELLFGLFDCKTFKIVCTKFKDLLVIHVDASKNSQMQRKSGIRLRTTCGRSVVSR